MSVNNVKKLLIISLLAIFGSYMLVMNGVEKIVKREINNSIAELDQQKSKFITLVCELENYRALLNSNIRC
jgi:uncharacterized membrane protein